MIASLGMYDRPELQPANDRYWALIRDNLRARGVEAPQALTRGPRAYMPAWQSPDLLLSQTCGLPYATLLHGQVTLVGTPDYGLPGCPPGYYNSAFVVRADDPRTTLAEFDGTPIAYSEAISQSGWGAPQNHAARHGLRFPAGLATGAHVSSAAAVADGHADLAALDCLSWAMIQECDPPLAARLREITRTEPTPATPLVTARPALTETLFVAVAEAIAALGATDRATLHLRGLVRIPDRAYLAVPLPPRP